MTEGSARSLSAAPYTTGGGGVVLEHRYGAIVLASVLTGDPLQQLGDDVTPVMVRFQASAFSPVDDLLVTGRTRDGGQRRASIGVRREPRLVRSDEASVSLLTSYLQVVTGSWGRGPVRALAACPCGCQPEPGSEANSRAYGDR